MLSGIFAVVAARADVVIAVKPLPEVFQLVEIAFLSAENIRLFPVDLVANHLAALRPYVAAYRIVTVFVTDVVGAGHQALCPCRQCA